ncbi:MAG: PAS-domain containing protein [Candidatus Thiodiazotropha sp.]
MSLPAWRRWLPVGIRRRLLLILGLAALAIGVASTVALLALLQTRDEVGQVMARELPTSAAALMLARVSERLQDRTPALMAARDADALQRQTELINRDLLTLADETERLSRLVTDEGIGVDEIPHLAARLSDNLRALADQLAVRAGYDGGLQRQRGRLVALRERVQQILGPSILAVADVVGESAPRDADLFRRAAQAQGPLLEAERLVGAAFGELLLAAEAATGDELRIARETFARRGHLLDDLMPRIPLGLRQELAGAIAELSDQAGDQGVFALRDGELAAIAKADTLAADSRNTATRLKSQVDGLVHSANAKIARAADAMGDAILANTLVFLAVSAALVLLATLLSYRFVVRDISDNLRAVTGAMQRLADGEREARVPAMQRRDEIGDLARVFNVFKENAFRMERLDRQLSEKSSLLLATFDSMNDGFTVCDAQDRLVAWNPRFLLLYGLSADDVEPDLPLTRVHRLLAQRGTRAFAALGEEIAMDSLALGRGSMNRQYEVRCPNGRRVELRSNPMPDGGYVTLHTDVTESRAIDKQLRQAQKMEAVGQLTGGLAHDFNNILAVILGNLTPLEESVRETPELHERWQRAMGAADRAARQVERLLAFSRRQRLQPERIDVNALLQGMIDLLEYSLGDSIRLETAFEPDLPPVFVDPGQLENALMNLALNASDAMNGKGRITFSTQRRDSGQIEITVTDTGYGIAPEMMSQVFEPFFTTKAAGKGSGLGLSMVYGFVHQSGGDIGIDSEPGRGTSISLRLPAAPAQLPSDAAAPAGDAPIASPQGRGETILVVDDDPELLQLSAEQLSRLGYRAIRADGGETALAALAQTPAIRLLYTDVAMPAPWDGVALAREALQRRPDLAILYTSGEMREIVEPPGELLRKPVQPEILGAALRRLLDSDPNDG